VLEAFVSPMGVDGFMPTQVCTKKNQKEPFLVFLRLTRPVWLFSSVNEKSWIFNNEKEISNECKISGTNKPINPINAHHNAHILQGEEPIHVEDARGNSAGSHRAAGSLQPSWQPSSSNPHIDYWEFT
jgi:hypothetical protein